MQRVTGIGGFFFRARDPETLSKWYATHLGVDPVPTDYESQPWSQTAGPTVWAAFAADTDYFGRPEQSWMINFRVDDLEAMTAQLRSAGIEVVEEGVEPNGAFARLTDPEGNPIQLWQPSQPAR